MNESGKKMNKIFLTQNNNKPANCNHFTQQRTTHTRLKNGISKWAFFAQINNCGAKTHSKENKNCVVSSSAFA